MRRLALFLVVVVALGIVAWREAEGDASATRATDVAVRDEIVFTRTVRQFGRPDLYVMATDGSRMRLLTRNAGHAAVSPDGASIAFVRKGPKSRCETIWLMRRDGSGQRRLTKPPDQPETCDTDPAWSPDGRTIYFSRGSTTKNGDFESSLFAIGTDKTALRLTRATPEPDGDCHVDPAPSPNGRLLAYSHFRPCVRELISWIEAVTTTGRRARLPFSTDVGGAQFFEHPAWAPDGRRLAFSATYTEESPVISGLWVSPRGGAPPRHLVKAYGIYDAAWSPDGAMIAFSEEGIDQEWYPRDICVVRSDGKGLRRITSTGADDTSPAWLPPAAG